MSKAGITPVVDIIYSEAIGAQDVIHDMLTLELCDKYARA